MKNAEKSTGIKIGTVSVSMYKDPKSNLYFFKINPENDDMLQLAYIIEDTLVDF